MVASRFRLTKATTFNVSPVPLPFAVWMFGSMLSGFIGMSWRTRVQEVSGSEFEAAITAAFFCSGRREYRDSGVGFLRETLTYRFVRSRLRAKIRLALTALTTPRI